MYINEAFETRKFDKGTVKFSRTSINDPHVEHILDLISKESKIPVPALKQQIIEKANKFNDIKDKAPLLYDTIALNIVEDELFKLFQKYIKGVVPGASKFNTRTFRELISWIQSDHSKQFNPLKSMMKAKPLFAPRIVFVPLAPDNKSKEDKAYADCDTACASPRGEFAFNTNFMQDLINFAYLKGIKPKGNKFKSNGGDIPDDYAYVEFVIIHEFMHYTYDDFHYQKVIKNANPTIINWVGDFRTNYLLVKSGYAQLPMGLFNDHVNFDRQGDYLEMYRIVDEEFKKLDKDQQDKVSNKMNESSDDHEPGQEQGEQMPEGGDKTEEDINNHNEKQKEKAENAKDTSGEEKNDAEKKKTQSDQPGDKPGQRGGRGKGGTAEEKADLDYTKVKPKFNWKALLKMFLATDRHEMEETRQKPSRRSASGIHVAVQMGAGALPPGEATADVTDAKLCFVVDSSGSMFTALSSVFANIHNLYRMHPQLQKQEFLLMKFSNSHTLYKCNVAKNKASKIEKHTDPNKANVDLKILFSKTVNGATNFTSSITADIKKLLDDKYNVMIFSDDDLSYGENMDELLKLIRSHPRQVFVIFDSRDSYLKFRTNGKIATNYITYLGD